MAVVHVHLGQRGGYGGPGASVRPLSAPVAVRKVVREVVHMTPNGAHHRPKFDVVVALDVSGSMAGQKIRDALASVQEIVEVLLEDDDGIGLVTFSHEVRVLLPLTRKRHLQHSSWASIMGAIQTSGRTALWDGILEGFRLLCRRERQRPPHPSHPYLIVVTDGMDNASLNKREAVQAVLEKPGEHGYGGLQAANFHLNLLTIGSDADRQGAKDLCAKKPHMKHFHAPTAGDLESTFWHVKQELQRVITITTTTTTVHQDVRDLPAGPYPSVPESQHNRDLPARLYPSRPESRSGKPALQPMFTAVHGVRDLPAGPYPSGPESRQGKPVFAAMHEVRENPMRPYLFEPEPHQPRRAPSAARPDYTAARLDLGSRPDGGGRGRGSAQRRCASRG